MTLAVDGFPKIFITHASGEKELASEVKSYLRMIGFLGFVAHEDIEATREWENVILQELSTCAGMVVIASSSAKESFYVNQEIGSAIGAGRGVVSILNGCAPWGMLARYQALRWASSDPAKSKKWGDRDAMEANLPALFRALSNVGVASKAHLIEGIGASSSYEEARVTARMLADMGDLDQSQALRLAELTASNMIVSECWEAQYKLPPLFLPFRDKMDHRISDKLEETFLKKWNLQQRLAAQREASRPDTGGSESRAEQPNSG